MQNQLAIKTSVLRVLTYIVSFPLVLALTACSLGKTYAEINPAGAREDVRRHSGYYSLKKISPGTAKIVYRSERPGFFVTMSSSTSSVPGQDMKRVGTVVNTARGYIYPAIANMTAKLMISDEFIEVETSDFSPLQVEASAVRRSQTTFWNSSDSCGPTRSQFSPVADRAYVVEFTTEGNSCLLKIFDATDPDAPVEIRSSRQVGAQ